MMEGGKERKEKGKERETVERKKRLVVGTEKRRKEGKLLTQSPIPSKISFKNRRSRHGQSISIISIHRILRHKGLQIQGQSELYRKIMAKKTEENGKAEEVKTFSNTGKQRERFPP